MPIAKGSWPVIGFTCLFRLPSAPKYARGMKVGEDLPTVSSTVVSLICLVTNKFDNNCELNSAYQKEGLVGGLTDCCFFNTPLLSN